jgi:hypothetical protein
MKSHIADIIVPVHYQGDKLGVHVCADTKLTNTCTLSITATVVYVRCCCTQ